LGGKKSNTDKFPYFADTTDERGEKGTEREGDFTDNLIG
jgi:hypothetical protein